MEIEQDIMIIFINKEGIQGLLLAKYSDSKFIGLIEIKENWLQWLAAIQTNKNCIYMIYALSSAETPIAFYYGDKQGRLVYFLP